MFKSIKIITPKTLQDIYEEAVNCARNAILSKHNWQDSLFQMKQAYLSYIESFSQENIIDAYLKLKSSLGTTRVSLNTKYSNQRQSFSLQENLEVISINEMIAQLLLDLSFAIYEKIIKDISEESYLLIYKESSDHVFTFFRANRLRFEALSKSSDVNDVILIDSIKHSLSFFEDAFTKMEALELPYIGEWQQIENFIFSTLEKTLIIAKQNPDHFLLADIWDQWTSLLHLLKDCQIIVNGHSLNDQKKLLHFEAAIANHLKSVSDNFIDQEKSSKKKKRKKSTSKKQKEEEQYFDCRSYDDTLTDPLLVIACNQMLEDLQCNDLTDDDFEYFDANDGLQHGLHATDTTSHATILDIDAIAPAAIASCADSTALSSDIVVTSYNIITASLNTKASNKKAERKDKRQQKIDHINDLQKQVERSENSTELIELSKQLTTQQQQENNPTVLCAIESLNLLIAHKLSIFTPTIVDRGMDSDSEGSGLTSHDGLISDTASLPEDFFQWTRAPKCIESVTHAEILQQLTRIAQDTDTNLYLYGSGIYKNHPNDIDFLLHYDDSLFINQLTARGACDKKEYCKPNRHVVQLKWLGVKLDINLSHKAWHEHAQQLDFTIGAAYFNVRTQQLHTRQAEILEHIDQQELHCAQANGSHYMLQQDPSILFRAIRLEREAGYQWSAEFQSAVAELAQDPVNPFCKVNPDKLYQEMVRLFNTGFACANLERLIELQMFEKLFTHLSHLDHTQKMQTYALSRQIAQLCDQGGQPDSLMYYAIHWSGASIQQGAVPASSPPIRLQQGHFPALNSAVHDYNIALLQRCASACHAPYYMSLQPPCLNHMPIPALSPYPPYISNAFLARDLTKRSPKT